jgi:AcrR family transcriptional regulator
MNHSTGSPPGLRERKREATRRRIAAEAARLATERGVAGVTTEEIAEAAEVSRATVFRYFDTKETAIAEGFSTPWVDGMLKTLADQPADLGPMEALTATFRLLGQLVDRSVHDLVIEQARIVQESPSLQAWIASAYLRDEELVADVIADRLASTDPLDPRPRLAGAIAMAAIRVGLDQWLAGDGEEDLAVLFERLVSGVQLREYGDR